MAVLSACPLLQLVERSLRTPTGYGLDFYRALGNEGRGTSRAVAAARHRSRTRCATPWSPPSWPSVLGVLRRLAPSPTAAAAGAAALLDTGLMLPLGTSAVTIGFGLLITMDRPPLDLRGSWIIIPHRPRAGGHAVRGARRAAVAARRSTRTCGEAAAVLGASPGAGLARGRRCRWSAGPLVVGAGFAFAVSLGEFGATVVPRPQRLARRCRSPSSGSSAGPVRSTSGQAMALAVILMVVTVVVILVVDRFRPAGTAEF